MIRVNKLYHSYGGEMVLKDINFHIKAGEIVALLGLNGAGKSSLMKILTTNLIPSHGSAVICGNDSHSKPFELKQNIGYFPENNPLYNDLTVYDSLHFVAQQRGIQRSEIDPAIIRVVEACDLHRVMHKRIKELSKGYRQRVGFAQAVIHEPNVLLLDEPSSGLDPMQIRMMRELIQRFKHERTVLISTHILQEVVALATRIIIIHRGEIRADASIEELRALAKGSHENLQNTANTLQNDQNILNLEDIFYFFTKDE